MSENKDVNVNEDQNLSKIIKYYYYYYYYYFQYYSYYPPKGGQAFLMSPPVCNLKAFSLISLFYISSFVLLPSTVALSVLYISAFDPFS